MPSDIPLSEAIERYLADAKAKPKPLAEKTVRDYSRYLRDFDRFTSHKTVRHAVTLANAEQWRDHLRGRGPDVTHNGSTVLKIFAKWLERSKVLARRGGGSVLDPFKPPPSPKRVPKPITDRALTLILDALANMKIDRYKRTAYVRLLLATGLRKQEARVFPLANLERDTNDSPVSLLLPAKSNEGTDQRSIRLDNATAKALADYLAHRPLSRATQPEPLFLRRDGKSYTEWGWSNWTDRLARELETKTGVKWSSKLMRHTWKQETEVGRIRDRALRSYCEELLAAPRHHDRAVREACVVLEDRIRKKSGANDDMYGTDLIAWAFDSDTPRIRVAQRKREQDGAKLLYLGVYQLYRNGLGHRLRDDVDNAEAFRVVAWIDHLLQLLEM